MSRLWRTIVVCFYVVYRIEGKSLERREQQSVAGLMGLAAFPLEREASKLIQEAEKERVEGVEDDREPRTFEDAMIENTRSKKRESVSDGFAEERFSQLAKSGKGGESNEDKVSTVDCCRLCPEQFQGIDVIPSQSFVELNEFVADTSSSALFARNTPVDSSTVNGATSRFAERDMKLKDLLAQGKAGKSGAGKTKPPPPKPVPLTIEQLIDQTPCCPVCLEQFDPPMDVDDASFLEISETVNRRRRPSAFMKKALGGDTTTFLETETRRGRLSTQARFSLGSKSKGDEKKPTCCTMCPNDELPAMGTFQASASSFLELDASEGITASKAGKGGDDDGDKRVRPDGCCNQCPASMFESAEIRFQEPQGGPFGLKPRMRSVSGAFPLATPPAEK